MAILAQVALFFASGGFGAALTQNSLLATCRPDLLHLPTTTVSTALVMRSKWVRYNNHRSRVGPDAFHWLGEVGRPRCQNQVLRSRNARGVRGLVSDALGNRFANKTTLQERVVYVQCVTYTCDLGYAINPRRRVFSVVVRLSLAVPWCTTSQKLKMLNGPRCLLDAMKKFPNGFLSTLESSALARAGFTTTGEIYEEGGAGFKEFRPVIFARVGFRSDFTQNSLLANVQSRFVAPFVLTSGGHCTDDDLEWVQGTPQACEGFGADFTNNSLLAQYRPDLLHLPTTNGEHCTGDA